MTRYWVEMNLSPIVDFVTDLDPDSPEFDEAFWKYFYTIQIDDRIEVMAAKITAVLDPSMED